MTFNEKEACKSLEAGEDGGADSDSEDMTFAEKIAAKKRQRLEKQYINCDFILGSVAEVERLWSIAKYVLTDNRKGLTPQLFEAILFLRLNAHFWDEADVQQAMAMARSARTQEMIQGDEQYFEATDVEDNY
jgi:hypothetical protein